MPDKPKQLHNFVALGHMNDALAGVFPSFAVDTTAVSTRSICLPEHGQFLQAWPSTLFQDRVTFNWLFLNASDIESQRTSQLMMLAQGNAPTMVFCYGRETEMEPSEIAAVIEATSRKSGRGMILSCYTESTFEAPQIFHAFLPKSVVATDSPPGYAQGTGAHDPCYGVACELILSNGSVSPSLVQRTLKLSYSRALQLISAMVGDILDRDPCDKSLSIRRGVQVFSITSG